MNVQSPFRAILQSVSVVFMTLAMSSCSFFSASPPLPQIKPHVSPHYTIDTYITHVSLADLALSQTPPAQEEAAPHLAAIQSYKVKQPTKSVLQPIIILEYTRKDKTEQQQAVAPFSILPQSDTFPALLEVMNTLSQTPYILHEIKHVMINVSPPSPLKFTNSDPSQTKDVLDNQLQSWLENTKAISPSEEIRIELRLIQFFTANHFKDAAYLSTENAKHSLAAATESGSLNPETAKKLSDQLEVLEGKLHKAMPFTL